MRVKVNTADNDGMTALHLAAGTGDSQMVKTLLGAGRLCRKPGRVFFSAVSQRPTVPSALLTPACPIPFRYIFFTLPSCPLKIRGSPGHQGQQRPRPLALCHLQPGYPVRWSWCPHWAFFYYNTSSHSAPPLMLHILGNPRDASQVSH
jgi:ankyrin repeat protein